MERLHTCNCKLCLKYNTKGYLSGRQWVDYLVNHHDRVLDDGDFYYYHMDDEFYILRSSRAVPMTELGYEEALLPEHFDTWKAEPVALERTPFSSYTSTYTGTSRASVQSER